MKNKAKWRIAACIFAILSVLEAGALGLLFSGVSVEPKSAYGGTVTAAAQTSRLAPESETFYDSAVRQTVLIRHTIVTDAGSKINTLGAGFIIDYDGYILTNCHVVNDGWLAGADIIVEDFDGNEYTAEVKGCDTVSDVALLKVEAHFDTVAELGSSAQIRPCQQVYIFGHPELELSFSVTSGIISGLNRSIDFSDGTTLNMFQVDAAVNHGNSGGPVFNDAGQVIGMTTAKYQGIAAEGLGFALPIDDVIKVAAELRKFGYVRGRPLLGITVQAIAAGAEGDNPAGVQVFSVEEGLCCDEAGVLPGDIIIGLRGKPVTDLESLTRAKLGSSAGDSAELKLWRDGEEITVIIIFDEVTPEHPTGTVQLPPESEGEEDAP